ncbi:MAG: hypothetical protein FWD96_06625 [Defluviitaleaceae bacterium]|nr:hypothetical protein [Defluviitaleaceae bacterium]
MKEIFWGLIVFLIMSVAVIGLITAELPPRPQPIVTTPFTVHPIIRYGIDVEDPGLFVRYIEAEHHPGRVYILGVFRGSMSSGTEVTHMIDGERLAMVLSESEQRRFRVWERNLYTSYPSNWSIFLMQDDIVHILLDNENSRLMSSNSARRYRISGAEAIEAALEQMIAKYTGE